jgi:hypothetical protein
MHLSEPSAVRGAVISTRSVNGQPILFFGLLLSNIVNSPQNPYKIIMLVHNGYSYVIDNILNCPDTNGYSIAIGKSVRGVNHAVVWKNGMAHDPHPDNTGLNEITRFEILTKE